MCRPPGERDTLRYTHIQYEQSFMTAITNYPKSIFVDIFNARFRRGNDRRFAACLDIGRDDGVSGIPVHSNKRWSLVLISFLQIVQIRLNDLKMLGVASFIRRLGV